LRCDRLRKWPVTRLHRPVGGAKMVDRAATRGESAGFGDQTTRPPQVRRGTYGGVVERYGGVVERSATRRPEAQISGGGRFELLVVEGFGAVKMRRSRERYFCASSAASAHLYPNGGKNSREFRDKSREPEFVVGRGRDWDFRCRVSGAGRCPNTVQNVPPGVLDSVALQSSHERAQEGTKTFEQEITERTEKAVGVWASFSLLAYVPMVFRFWCVAMRERSWSWVVGN
jgi:hypothetical protein